MTNTRSSQQIFVSGATGYIGGRLIPRLLEAGYRVRSFARSEHKLQSRPWAKHPRNTIVSGSIEEEKKLTESMQGCEAAYYLVHSMMAAGSEYRNRDRDLAATFSRAASSAGVKRIIYLGGLGETGECLSEHLTSRRETERELARSGVPVTVFRAAMIIGSGSASFEILRYLVERLPVMVTPRWVNTECQPIAIENVLHYLVRCLETKETIGQTLDIGGAEVMNYRAMMRTMAESRGLRTRLVLPVPILTPKLSSLWIHLVTPISHRIARPLAEGLRNRVVCRDQRAATLMPQNLLTVKEAIDVALGNRIAETSWSDAGPIPGDPDWAGGKVYLDRREVLVGSPPDEVYRAVCCIGGSHGWYAADGLWKLRGLLDRLIGGPGLRRGRRDPETVAYGEALDFWRVTGVEPGRKLELRAEMKLPGIAELSFEIKPVESNPEACRLIQSARFKPKGLSGILYWCLVSPLHRIVFNGMLRGIKRSAEEKKRANAQLPGPLGSNPTGS